MIIKKSTDIDSYLIDASNYTGSAEAVYIPESIDEVQVLIKSLFEEGIPITVSGSGTGLTGSRVPNEGVIISTERLKKISFDTTTKLLTVEPGVLLEEISIFLDEYNRFLPPNPTEWLCSIGGAVSTNASGSRTFKYGAMRSWVHSLEVVLPNGDIVHIPSDVIENNEFSVTTNSEKVITFTIESVSIPKTKHAAGYYVSPSMKKTDLFVGSEGTLGFIQSITLETYPKPEVLLGGVIFFQEYQQLLDFVSNLRSTSKLEDVHLQTVDARLLEFFDEYSLQLLRKYYPEIPSNAIGAIWFEQESSEDKMDIHIDEWWKVVAEFSNLADETWFAQNEIEHRKFSEFRHKLPSEVYEVIGKGSTSKIGTDMAVPAECFNEYFWEYQKVLKESQIKYVLFGHIGDCHLHANLFPSSEEEILLAKNIYEYMITKTLLFNGTISAEHGVGKLKKKYFHTMYSKDIIEYFYSIKLLFDPKNQFGKGNLF